MREQELQRNETSSSGIKRHASKMELWLSEDSEARRRFLKRALLAGDRIEAEGHRLDYEQTAAAEAIHAESGIDTREQFV